MPSPSLFQSVICIHKHKFLLMRGITVLSPNNTISVLVIHKHHHIYSTAILTLFQLFEVKMQQYVINTYFLSKKPFFDIYHHSYVVLTMWGDIVSQVSWIILVILLKSRGIHTLMYTRICISEKQIE